MALANGYSKVKSATAVMQDANTEFEYAWVELVTNDGIFIRPIRRNESADTLVRDFLRTRTTDDHCVQI